MVPTKMRFGSATCKFSACSKVFVLIVLSEVPKHKVYSTLEKVPTPNKPDGGRFAQTYHFPYLFDRRWPCPNQPGREQYHQHYQQRGDERRRFLCCRPIGPIQLFGDSQ